MLKVTSMLFIQLNAINANDIATLRKECDGLHRRAFDIDLSETGAALDIFEDSNIPTDSLARTRQFEYFCERWKNTCALFDNEKEVIMNILMVKLPRILSSALGITEPLFLFNEHYVVKDPDSNLAFRWHTDSNEQLAALSEVQRPEYYSFWCPLDEVSADNGTIVFPTAGVGKIGKIV